MTDFIRLGLPIKKPTSGDLTIRFNFVVDPNETFYYLMDILQVNVLIRRYQKIQKMFGFNSYIHTIINTEELRRLNNNREINEKRLFEFVGIVQGLAFIFVRNIKNYIRLNGLSKSQALILSTKESIEMFKQKVKLLSIISPDIAFKTKIRSQFKKDPEKANDLINFITYKFE